MDSDKKILPRFVVMPNPVV